MMKDARTPQHALEERETGARLLLANHTVDFAQFIQSQLASSNKL
jgi:hypothetical protein